jgi:hypothetical protein
MVSCTLKLKIAYKKKTQNKGSLLLDQEEVFFHHHHHHHSLLLTCPSRVSQRLLYMYDMIQKKEALLQSV